MIVCTCLNLINRPFKAAAILCLPQWITRKIVVAQKCEKSEKMKNALHIPPHSLYRCHTSGGVRRLATLALHFSLGGPLLCIGPGGLCEVRAAGGPQQTSGI